MSAGEWWGTLAVLGLWGLVILSVWWRDRARRRDARREERAVRAARERLGWKP